MMCPGRSPVFQKGTSSRAPTGHTRPRWGHSRPTVVKPCPYPLPLCHPRESGDPWSAPKFLDSHFRGKDGLGTGMTGWGLGRTKGDDLFSVGAQHDVPREITRFPKGHVKPCPYGTYEISLGTFPVNGRQAVPLSSPPFLSSSRKRGSMVRTRFSGFPLSWE
ncbi:MAG: hypothetical protein DIKNOCCD_00916 [bacterium]|nr:hypothetical protein [bacterium]